MVHRITRRLDRLERFNETELQCSDCGCPRGSKMLRFLPPGQNDEAAHDPDTEPCIDDLNCDGIDDGAGLLIMLSEWGECADPDDCPAGLNGDGVVNGADLLILLSN